MGLFINAAEAILLGFQHYLVMLGTTVLIPSSLVPQMGGGNVRLISISHHYIIILIQVLLYGQAQKLAPHQSIDYWFFTGRESEGDSDTTVCCWFEHIDSDIIWNQITCCDWRVLHLCSNDTFNCLGWSIQWNFRSC